MDKNQTKKMAWQTLVLAVMIVTTLAVMAYFTLAHFATGAFSLPNWVQTLFEVARIAGPFSFYSKNFSISFTNSS